MRFNGISVRAVHVWPLYVSTTCEAFLMYVYLRVDCMIHLFLMNFGTAELASTDTINIANVLLWQVLNRWWTQSQWGSITYVCCVLCRCPVWYIVNWINFLFMLFSHAWQTQLSTVIVYSMTRSSVESSWSQVDRCV